MALPLGPFWGVLAERFSRRVILLRTYVVLAISLMVAVYAESLVPYLDFGWAPLHALRRLGDKFVLAPRPEWVRTLPGGKLPDRGDFKAFGDDREGRMRAWRRALAESQRLAEEFEALVSRGSIAAEPLA